VTLLLHAHLIESPDKAYDGHMNLILSDVEETIMIVDTDSQDQTINVWNKASAATPRTHYSSGRETEVRDAFC
jgi:small nuclear ribonucleoprotein (snRNP)-like protein